MERSIYPLYRSAIEVYGKPYEERTNERLRALRVRDRRFVEAGLS